MAHDINLELTNSSQTQTLKVPHQGDRYFLAIQLVPQFSLALAIRIEILSALAVRAAVIFALAIKNWNWGIGVNCNANELFPISEWNRIH